MDELRKKTRDAIDALHGRLKECQLAMLIDQETGLVLCKSSASPTSQTKVEQIAADALSEINVPSAVSFQKSVEAPELVSITRLQQSLVMVIIQDLRKKEDALVCLFKKQPNRAYLMEVASEIFNLPSTMEAA